MINRIVMSKPLPLPVVLKYVDIRSYVFTAVFVASSIFVPWVFHQFHLAGPTFLPMHIFILLAGVLFGWRAGLTVGFLTPLASYAVLGMPALQILPQVVVEVSTYGLIAGVMREKFNLRVIWCLLVAMVGGRLVLFMAAAAIYFTLGESYSPLGAEANPLFVVWSAVKQGWLGILIQLVSIPLLMCLIRRFLGDRSTL